jgi:minor extracellular serine protease Vpr
VSGAAALLLEKYPSIHHHEIKSLLMTTSERVSDAYGQEFSLSDSGSGRLNIAKAFEAKLIIIPPNFVINLSSDNPTSQRQLELKTLEGTLENLEIKFEGSEFIQFAHILEGNNLLIKIKMQGQNYGNHEGKIIINHDQINYVIPFLIHYTEGSISVNQKEGKLDFEIYHPEQWNFAKISVINSKDGKIQTTTATPERDSTVRVYENGEYWIDAKIKVDGKTFDAYNTIEVNSINENAQNGFEIANISEKHIAIVSGIAMIIGIFGIIVKRKIDTKV